MTAQTDREAVLTELQKLQEIATLQQVKDFLRQEISRVQAESIHRVTATPSEASPATRATSAATIPVSVKQIGTYGYDQDDDEYVIIVTENMQNVKKDSVSCDFTQTSFVLHVRIPDENGSSVTEHRLEVRNLFGSIDPAKSRARAGKKQVVVTLKKAENGRRWDALTKVEHSILEKSKPKFDRKKRGDDLADPSASLMNLMRDMYEQGDDQMKQTIAKAFYESNQKQNAA